MPQIPQAIDYGGRPSLKTGRLDRPANVSTQTADALVSAATEFKSIMDQKKAKPMDQTNMIAPATAGTTNTDLDIVHLHAHIHALSA